MRRLPLILLALASIMSARAEVRDPAQYDRLLLPFHASVPAFHGRWRVEWWLRNDGIAPVDAFPIGCLIVPPFPGFPVSIARPPSVSPLSTLACYAGDALPTFLIAPSVPVRDSVGAFLYVQKSRMNLSVAGSLAWEAGQERAEPTPLQAIPEAAFRRGTGSVLPIPVSPDARYALRIYALPETLDAKQVVVRIFAMQPQLEFDPTERLIATLHGDLETQDAVLGPCISACDVPNVPLAPALYQRFGLPVPERGYLFQSPMRVEISPASSEVRWWAVVSATDNRTQRVTLFQPSF